MKRTPLARRTPLRSGGSLLLRAVKKFRRPRDTGPTQATRITVTLRSGGICEWPECWHPATDMHHRLNRKMGGRKGEIADLLNSPAWLLHACHTHHAGVTSRYGPEYVQARVYGWVLHEHEDARCVPTRTRHGVVLLDHVGGWEIA